MNCRMTKGEKCKSRTDLVLWTDCGSEKRVQMLDFAILRGLYQNKPKSYEQNRAIPYKLFFPKIADCSWVIFCFISD